MPFSIVAEVLYPASTGGRGGAASALRTRLFVLQKHQRAAFRPVCGVFLPRGQLREAQQATRSAEGELAEMRRRHREKVAHWESAQEALDQLTDELQVSQDLLRESGRREEHLRGQLGALQQQLDALQQQVCVDGNLQ